MTLPQSFSLRRGRPARWLLQLVMVIPLEVRPGNDLIPLAVVGAGVALDGGGLARLDEFFLRMFC